MEKIKLNIYPTNESGFNIDGWKLHEGELPSIEVEHAGMSIALTFKGDCIGLVVFNIKNGELGDVLLEQTLNVN